MSKGYEQIKNLVSDASDQMLVDMYKKIIIDEGSDVAEIAVKTRSNPNWKIVALLRLMKILLNTILFNRKI